MSTCVSTDRVSGPPWTITVDDLPPSPNRRLHWACRRRLVKPLADPVAWQARAVGLPQPLEHAHVVAKLVHSRPPLRDWDNAVSTNLASRQRMPGTPWTYCISLRLRAIRRWNSSSMGPA